MRSPDELTAAFRARGLKVTPQRQAIFRALHGATSHPSAEWVHRTVAASMPTISLRTVYQTLGDLAEMGEIVHLDLGTGAARFDTNLEPHHHLVCDGCGLVRDVAVDHPDVRPALVATSGGVADGFRVTGTEIVFRGLCVDCAEAPASPENSLSATTNDRR